MRKKNTHSKAALGVAIVVLAALGWFAGIASAGMITVEAVDDHYAKGGAYADDVINGNGDGDTLVIKNSSNAGTQRKAWAKFDLSGYNVDTTAGATITLRIGSTTRVGVLRVAVLNSGFTGTTDWDEDTLTWNNAPANNTGSRTSFTSDATELTDSLAFDGADGIGTAYTVNIAQLGAFIQSDNTVTIMFSGATGVDETPFISSEHDTYDGPQLTFTVIPEPSSVCLIVAGIGLMMRRRNG